MAVQTRSQAHKQALLEAEKLKNASFATKRFLYIRTKLNHFYNSVIAKVKKAYQYISAKSKKAYRYVAAKTKKAYEYFSGRLLNSKNRFGEFATNRFGEFKNFFSGLIRFNKKEIDPKVQANSTIPTAENKITEVKEKEVTAITPLRNKRKENQQKNVGSDKTVIDSPRRSPRLAAS